MVKIPIDLLPKQKSRKHNLNVDIDLYPLASELYEELERIGIIGRVKEVHQLGVIKVDKKLIKTRYDYIMLQLYLLSIIKAHLQGHLKITLNNLVSRDEFLCESVSFKKEKPSVADIIQLLAIVYNIGHFYNTFTASRAVIMLASRDKAFYDIVVCASSDERYKNAARIIVDSKNYHRLHLLNSILVLEQCDRTKPSVSLALEILYSYINESMLPENSKLRYAFDVFKKVRTISYIAYDLPVSETPLMLDLCNEKSLLVLLRELLSEYNNNQSSNNLVKSVTKLLDDTVYNEMSNALCFYRISQSMVTLISKSPDYPNGIRYYELFILKNSILNRTYPHKRDFVANHVLKLTFSKEERGYSESLLERIEKMNYTRVGYYDRHSGEQTVLVSIKSRCDSSQKRYAAFKTMRSAVSILRSIPGISSSDKRFILCTKFFLFYLFDENPVMIKPTIHEKKCVICTRGKSARIKELQSLLRDSVGKPYENHEVEFLMSRYVADSVNDTCISVPASILVYQKEAVGKTKSEFDGMIIYPMRKTNNVVFLEAKSGIEVGKTCLKNKIDLFSFANSCDEIIPVSHDAYLNYSVRNSYP